VRLLLSAFLLDKQAQRCTPKTLEHYTYTVGGFISYLEGKGVGMVQDITAHDIRDYLVGLQKRGLKDTTQHAHARGIKAWLNWLVREDVLQVSPMARVSMPRLDKTLRPPFTPEDIKALLGVCDNFRDRAIILGLLDSGLRASEMVSLKVDDIDMKTGLVTVVGKGNKQRQVRFGVKTRKAILKYLATRQGCLEALWMTQRGQLTRRGLQALCRRLGDRAGVKCYPHRFRRTFALWCLRDGMDLHSLRVLMGHSSLAVLQRYLALAGEDIERAHKLHSPVDKLL
jgi:integrase/recombinase XerD